MSALADQRPPEGAVASLRHTIGFLVAASLLAIGGAFLSPISEWPRTLASQQARLLLYTKIMVLQWIWVAYVLWGMRDSTNSTWALIDNSQWTVLRWLRYLAIGVAGFILYLALGAGLTRILQPSSEALRGLQVMLPHTPAERLFWAASALTAGVCEELVYRGYLLRQFRSLTRSGLAAVILQALCYTLIHLALPIQMLVGVAILGLLLGAIAVWQKSLVPGMMLHVAVGMVAMVQPG